MNLGTFCPLEKHWHILTPLLAFFRNVYRKFLVFFKPPRGEICGTQFQSGQ
jgi:hypothetical protein